MYSVIYYAQIPDTMTIPSIVNTNNQEHRACIQWVFFVYAKFTLCI